MAHASENAEDDDNDPAIKVCVRLRPFIKEELEGQRSGGQTELCVKMPTKTSVELLGRTPEPKSFEFDRCYWSHSEDHPYFADQDTLYDELGKGMLRQALKGFNNCIFAYGQTGSGKSYSVLGGKEPKQQGLLPRIVTGLFEEFALLDERDEKKCTVAFVEIYNEQIIDLLLSASAEPQKLEVRHHPTLGTFIPGLTESPVETEDGVMKLVDYGTTMRHVSATAMNATSSRSHCIFSFKTAITKAFSGQVFSSQTHLVDLAGSERAARTKAEGARLKEGAAINQSLSTLARVISDLAKQSQLKGDKRKTVNPPFRDSKITYILKESLCGNSKTVMMAAISPNLLDYEETLSTMKFCQTVKMVQTSAKKNEVNKEGLEAQLKYELQLLKEQLEKCEAEKDADHRKMSEALKNLQAQKELVDKNCTDWGEQLNMERKRQSHREAIMMSEEGRSDLVRRLTTMSRLKDDDSDTSSIYDPKFDASDADGITNGYERIQELAKSWELARTRAQSTMKSMSESTTKEEGDKADSNMQLRLKDHQDREKGAKEDYSEGLHDFRGVLQEEIERLQTLMQEVDERWDYLHGTTNNEREDTSKSANRPAVVSRTNTRTLRSGQFDDLYKSDSFLRLQRQATNIKKAVDAISDSGAPELNVRVLVVVDPTNGEHDLCVQAASLPVVSRQLVTRGSVKLVIGPRREDFPKDATELLTDKDLNSRWAWLEERCNEIVESKDIQTEQDAEKKEVVSAELQRFVPKDGKRYGDPWREMSISCLRRDLKDIGQQLMSNTAIVRDDGGNAEKRDRPKAQGWSGVKADYSFGAAFGLGLGASFEEATCQIDMAQALLRTLQLQRKKGKRGSVRRKKDSATSHSPPPTSRGMT